MSDSRLPPTMSRPHVVLLGAGASRAAFPDGDASGRRLPVMNDLIEVTGLQQLVAKAGLQPGRNFEETYDELRANPDLAPLAAELEDSIRTYFGEMQLPDQPTLYDHLVLSLRPKDVVATFNWDPLLAQACVRNAHVAQPPMVLFLHGNTGIGVCEDCFLLRPVVLTLWPPNRAYAAAVSDREEGLLFGPVHPKRVGKRPSRVEAGVHVHDLWI